jgi:hypothetical protein
LLQLSVPFLLLCIFRAALFLLGFRSFRVLKLLLLFVFLVLVLIGADLDLILIHIILFLVGLVVLLIS